MMMKRYTAILCSIVLAVMAAIASGARKTTENNNDSSPLMGIHVSGNSSYEIGRKTGLFVKDQLEKLLEVDTTLDDYLIPWLEENTEIYNDYLALNSKTFPDQFEELQGFSDATGMNLTHLILLMLRPEIQGLLAEQGNGTDVLEATENCFDVIANPSASGKGLIIGHNEDWATEYGQFGYLIYVAQSHNPDAAREIVTYSYPASSLGFTFGWNSEGLIVSCNGITPIHPNAGGFGRYFINRYVLEAPSVAEAVRRLQTLSADASYGFGVTLAEMHSNVATHIEIGPKRFSMVEVKRGESFVHTNRFSHEAMLDIPQTIGPSTTSRYARGLEFGHIETEEEVRSLLGDTKNASYPMYRTGTKPDTGATLVTAVFDMEARTVTIYNTNPKDTEALMVVPIYEGKGKREDKKGGADIYMDVFWPVLAIAVIAVAFAIAGFVLYFRKSNSYERALKDPLLNN